MKYVPLQTIDGGTAVGNSYISTAARCWRKFFNTYWLPTVDAAGQVQAHGVEPIKKGKGLVTGSIFHKGMEVYYRSGCRDGSDTGEYRLDKAIAAIEAAFGEQRELYENAELAEGELVNLKTMMLQYDEEVGPNGKAPDYPSMQVVCNDLTGEPMIETDWVIPLDYKDYYLTCRTDLIVNELGFIKSLEHKTSIASYVNQRLRSIHTDSQFTTEIYAMQQGLPGEPTSGARCNVITSHRAVRSTLRPVNRETTTRTAGQLREFRDMCVDTLMQIDERLGNYNEWIDRGIAAEHAKSVWFPTTGTMTQTCDAYGGCHFLIVCKNPERAHLQMGSYKPRIVTPQVTLQIEETN